MHEHVTIFSIIIVVHEYVPIVIQNFKLSLQLTSM
jgi:hypothetical protein